MTTDGTARRLDPHLVSVVVPVYQGEQHLSTLVKQLSAYVEPTDSPAGYPYRVLEVILVYDCGPDDSPRVLHELEREYDHVRVVWLSRNFGQHAATLAGMASSAGEWIATMDEDGQHDPAYLGDLLDAALTHEASLVYAAPTNRPPHSFVRNLTSRSAKRVVNLLGSGIDASVFHSYRFVLGEIGRSVAAYAGAGVYLDIALSWVAGRPATAPVVLRTEGERQSGYSPRRLLSHFWSMVLSSGTRGLRLVSGLGVAFAALGLLFAVFLVIERFTDPAPVQGWTSTVVVLLLCTGAILFSLGVIAEYVGVAVNMAMGKPPYLIVRDPADGPLGRLAGSRRAGE